jgi:DNA modification methylase
MAQRVLSVEYRSLTSVRFDPRNPRRHSKKQIRQIARSIETFGFNVPVLIDGKGQLIAGHGRVLAARALGITQVPTIALEHLSEAQARAFIIADNRLSENSVWDDRLLAAQLKELSALKLDFTLEVTGFATSEINMLIEDLAPVSRGKSDPADAMPDSCPKLQITHSGDLWVLGRHRVYCADARNDSAYSNLMGSQYAHMVFTDLCHNDRIGGYVTGFGNICDPEFAVTSAQMSQSEGVDFLGDVLTQLARNTIDGALHFISIDWRLCGELFRAARSVYTEFADLCVWMKNRAAQGGLYRSQHDLVFIFKSGKKRHRNARRFGHGRTNVWEYRTVNSLTGDTAKGNPAALHSTIKPVELIADAIRDCTARRDIVLDPFLGSGSTVLAGERTGRACYGLELDPCAVDTIVRRWQRFTVQNAVHASTGRTFNEMEKENHGRNR